MNQTEMIQSLRAEIAKLQRVLDLLLDHPSDAEQGGHPGSPKGPGNGATSLNPELTPRKRTMSAEGKARIAAAQKKRWAAQRSVTPAPSSRRVSTATKGSSKTAPKKDTGAGKRNTST